MSAPVWTPLGPGCVINEPVTSKTSQRSVCSGRINAIAIDPVDPENIIYVGARSGGVWKTADGGLHWIPLTDDVATRISCLTIDSGRVLAGYGDAHGPWGVLMLPAGSDTWQRFPSEGAFDITALLVDPVNTDHWYAAADSGFFERNGNGQPWVQVPVAAAGFEQCFDAVMDRSNPSTPILYVAVLGKGVFRRVGSGPFQLIPGSPTVNSAIRLALCARHPATLYVAWADAATTTVIVQGTDNANAANVGDVNWSKGGRLTDFLGTWVLAVAPDNPQVVFAGGQYLWRSTNGGGQWEQIQGIHVDQHAITFHPQFDSQTLPTIWLGNDGGVWRSRDGGTQWVHRNRGLHTLEFYAIAQDPRYESVILAGSQDNGAMRFEGSGGWPHVGSGDIWSALIDPHQPNIWYFVSPLNPLHRSITAGNSESAVVKGLHADDLITLFTQMTLALDPATSAVYAAGGKSGRVYVLSSDGSEWKPIRTGSGATLADFTAAVTALAIAPDTIYAGTNTDFWSLKRLADGTYAPTKLSRPAETGSIIEIAVHPASPDKIYVVGPADGVFRSDHAGAPWIPLTAADPEFTVARMKSVAIDPDNPQHIYVGGTRGIFRSPDEGATWERWSDNLPRLEVKRVAIHQHARLIRAATFGRGIWQRPLDLTTAGDVQLYLRDNILDIGIDRRMDAGTIVKRPTEEAAHPYDPHVNETIFSGADLKVDYGTTEFTSTLDYTSLTGVDYIGFQDFRSKKPRRGTDMRLYLQVHNHGPRVARNVQARLFWANKGGSTFPDLPADFWTQFPAAEPSDTSTWHPIGSAQTVAELHPAEPIVLTFAWPAQALGDTVGVLAAVTSPDDPIQETGLSVADVVPTARQVLLKEMTVESGSNTGKIVFAAVLGALALIVVGGIAIKKLT